MPTNLILKSPREYYAQFNSVKEQFKQLQRFDINDPQVHRLSWADKFLAVLADSNEAAYTHHLHLHDRTLQLIAHGPNLAAAVQAKQLLTEMPAMKKRYFMYHSHLVTAAQECRDGEKMGEIVSHLGAAEVALHKICAYDEKLTTFVKKFTNG